VTVLVSCAHLVLWATVVAKLSQPEVYVDECCRVTARRNTEQDNRIINTILIILSHVQAFNRIVLM